MDDVRRIVTAGSIWTFRETEHLYLRLPRYEIGRARAEWGDERAGPLQDGIWHPFSYWGVTVHPDGPALQIRDARGGRVCEAPEPRSLLGTRHQCAVHLDPPPLWFDDPQDDVIGEVRSYLRSLPDDVAADGTQRREAGVRDAGERRR